MIPFSGSPLNRASEKRTDQNWIESKRRDPSSLVLPMRRLEPFLLGAENAVPPIELGLVRTEIADSLASDDALCIFLGLDRDTAVFALDVTEADDAHIGRLASLGRWSRSSTPRLSRRRKR
jgi:NAD+ diphosphatase